MFKQYKKLTGMGLIQRLLDAPVRGSYFFLSECSAEPVAEWCRFVGLLQNIFKIGQKICKNTTITKQNVDLLSI